MAIDFSLSETQREIQASAADFAARFLAPLAAKIDQIPDSWESFLATREAYREMARAGFTRAFIPEAYGGLGFSMVDFAVAAEELSRVEMNVPTTLLGSGLGLQPIIQLGTHEQKERFLADFAADEEGEYLASFAFTDVAGGANYDSNQAPAGIQTIARREGDQWVINGQKHYTTNGTGWDKTGAHLFTVVCRTDKNKGADESLAVIAVPGNTPGIEVVSVYDKIGHRGVVTPAVNFTDVCVPVDNMIGQVGDGKAIVSRSFSWTGGLIGAACVGVMRAAFEHALEFARTEKRLGTVPVLEYQNVGFMLTDIKMNIEAARYLTWKACHDLDASGGASEETAIIAKIYCSELAVKTVYDAMQVVGVESYIKDAPFDRLMRDAMVFPLYDGGNRGIRRRQMHEMMKSPDYDSMQAAHCRYPSGK